MSSGQYMLDSSFLLILLAAGSKKYAILNSIFNVYFAQHKANFSFQLHLLMLNRNLELLHSSLSCTIFRGLFVCMVPNSALFNIVQVTLQEVSLKRKFLMFGHGFLKDNSILHVLNNMDSLIFPQDCSVLLVVDNLNPNKVLVNPLH